MKSAFAAPLRLAGRIFAGVCLRRRREHVDSSRHVDRQAGGKGPQAAARTGAEPPRDLLLNK